MASDIYLDANATSPVLPSAIAAAVEAMEAQFGNPSSSHATGLRARRILDTTRARARRVLGAGPGRVLFTSGATEGIQTAVLSALVAVRERRAAGEDCGDLLVYGATEHKAVSESLAHWNRLLGTGLTLLALPVDAAGRHRLDVLRDLAPRAAMVCTMAANNETGAISDLDGIARVLRESGSKAYWMVDCVQALGKLPLDLANTRIDYAPFSGHKLHAPKGIGILYVRDGAPYTPLMIGGGQEGGQRSGTENMAGIAALGAVLAALEEGTTFRGHAELAAMRDRLAATLRDAFPAIVFNAPFEHTLPTTLNFAVPGVSSKDLLDLFDAAGVRVSAGSACSAAKAAPSYVLDAMGLPLWRSGGAVRLSIGPLADDAFVDAACARIRHCGEALRASRFKDGSPGVMQVSGDGRYGWIVFDATTCVVIDPPRDQLERIAALARDAGLRVLDVDVADHATVELDDGSHAPCIVIGGAVLARLPDGWLLGDADAGHLRRTAVRHVFGAVDAGRLARVAHDGAVICHGADVDGLAWATPRARDGGTAGQLHQDTLDVFLRRHEDALLVDVREAFEAAAGPMVLHGRAARNVPLSRLAEHVAGWLAEPARPIVFVCRSGNRSAKAATLLRRAGHAQAWTVVGGLALA
ncbi:aminotransferase class V-fold PLP-dependent enzyme [Massilia putida]|uniref:aminotransferase class V-fold PLP-dependent enzyme n=1 Tax=Massilia putida TaxID=1141883 RepID=UPI0009524259|nr:aminotransferase class V-fold PLP-dependent enzyme [Massilia putida]